MKVSSMLTKICAIIFMGGVFIAPAMADYNSAGIPDSTQVRREILKTWLTPSYRSVRGKEPELRTGETGTLFQVSVDENDEEFSVEIAPESFSEMTYITDGEAKIVKERVFLKYVCGSWILVRKKSDSEPVRIEFRFTNNPDVYMQFRPNGNKTYVDLIAYGSYISRSVPVMAPFENIYAYSFQDFYNLTKNAISWASVLPHLEQYDDVKRMIGTIRQKIPYIDFSKFSAYNEDGVLYSIQTGKVEESTEKDPVLEAYRKNKTVTQESDLEERIRLGSPGFVKWVVDGIISPVTGEGTSISELLEPTVQFNNLSKKGVKSQFWNLTLNLDWVRNLAFKAMAVRSGLHLKNYKNAGIDVTITPFSADIMPNGSVIKNPGYMSDIGYSVTNLRGLFYVLGVTEPGWFYIGAVRHTSSDNVGESVFDESAVFFPFFDSNGLFGCTVFESGIEMSLDDFIARNAGSYVHLERIKASEVFFPR